ncbi:MAG: FKBP-type peptidyl-prolyl cis-trans isomerase [Bacteroidales bacterium]|nr:FKBP-type peptidyl-prolyl cis-trans isomerase [Bacteroidales bacterium]
MKKISMMLAAAAAVIMSACGGSGKAPEAKLTNDLDSICYGIGISEGRNVAMSMFDAERGGIDSAYIDDFVKGILDATNAGMDEKKKAYYAGLGLGGQLSSQIDDYMRNIIYGRDADSAAVVNRDQFLAGFIATLKSETTLYGDSVEAVMQKLSENIQALRDKAAEKKYGQYIKENEAYMKKVSGEAGVKPLANGVYYKVVKEGTGEVPAADARVKIHYEGKTIDGNVFDSSYERNEPAEMSCNGVVPGFSTALTSMPVGSKWEVYIPADQAYGSQDMQVIKPYSTLIFTIELLEILK